MMPQQQKISNLPDPAIFAELLRPQLQPGVIETLDPSIRFRGYRDDPVGFAKKELGIEFTEDICRMAESVRDNVVTLARSSTGTGKSHGAAVLAGWFYKCLPDSRVYTIANPYDNQKILWSEIVALSDNHPDVFQNDRITTMNIERSSKDFIKALTVPTTGTEETKEGKFSGRHHKHMLFIVDEGDTVPDFVYRGVEGCMSGGLIVRLLILFNPRYQIGVPYRYERDKKASVVHLSALNHPNVITGEQIIPGAVDRGTTVRRLNEWTRPLMPGEKGKDTFEVPDFLVGSVGHNSNGKPFPPLEPGLREIMEPAFSYMVLGRYPAQGASQLISRAWTDAARARWDLYVAEYGEVPPVGIIGVGGLDVADDGADLNVLTKRYGGYVQRQESWSGMDLEETGRKTAEIYRKSNLISINVDGIGVGAGVPAHLRKMGVNAHKIKSSSKTDGATEFGEFDRAHDEMLWSVREWLKNDPGSMLPPDEFLLEELHVPKFLVGDNGKVKVTPSKVMKEELKRSPDKLMSLAETFAKTVEVEQAESLEGCFV